MSGVIIRRGFLCVRYSPITHPNASAAEAVKQSVRRRYILFTEEGHKVDRTLCQFCGKCVEICPAEALEVLGERITSEKAVKQLLRDKHYFYRRGRNYLIRRRSPDAAGIRDSDSKRSESGRCEHGAGDQWNPSLGIL